MVIWGSLCSSLFLEIDYSVINAVIVLGTCTNEVVVVVVVVVVLSYTLCMQIG